jgi:hypothetical protein
MHWFNPVEELQTFVVAGMSGATGRCYQWQLVYNPFSLNGVSSPT